MGGQDWTLKTEGGDFACPTQRKGPVYQRRDSIIANLHESILSLTVYKTAQLTCQVAVEMFDIGYVCARGRTLDLGRSALVFAADLGYSLFPSLHGALGS